MIKKMYIINPSGGCIYYYNFFTLNKHTDELSKTCNDTQLISGFFSAMDCFVSTAIEETQELKCIVLTGLIFYFYKRKEYKFVLESDSLNKNMYHEDYIAILKKICEMFEFKFLQNDVDLIMDIEDDEFTEFIKSTVSKTVRESLFKNVEKKNEFQYINA